ncbi:NAD(P)/FAD-dependent oxidoreductase [Rossellomorea aquimaris]|uniref:phytoene desaturase family protein n=1 Tax=Rossellomorea aquimaris TaxID=189382 RepID=UPI001CD5C0D3|nr:NAD(P)/FAD-dependent oxidoreductase [Rossellomorea aquimaris]MCA1054267.1 NAD(P)/FAD-dependent oxidoreductase [Rossellomorea aquimaris]
MSKSVCIIGAGVGGLTAAAYLAKAGYKVTVLEKATTVGGSAGWYVRSGRKFPTGATIAFGLEEKGLLRTLLNELDIDLPAEELLHPMDVVLPEGKVSIVKSPAMWEQELTEAFHPRSEDVLRFWDTLQRISDDVLAVTESGVSLPIRKRYDLGSLPRHAVRHPRSMARLARYALYTVEDLMRKYHLDSYEPLRQLLDSQLLDAVQTDVREAALLPSSLALTIYRRGSFFIENGMGQLGKALAQRIKDLGGEIVKVSPVESLVYEESRKQWSVVSRKCTSTFDFVINNSGISFGEGTSYESEDEFSWGAFRIDAILSREGLSDSLKDRKLPFAYQIVPSLDSPNLRANTHGPVYVTFNHAVDRKGETVEGEVMMTVSLHTELESWSGYTEDEYKQIKERVTEEILEEIEKVIPVKENLLFAEAGTPLTYERYIGKRSVGGFPLTVRNAITKPKSVRSSLPQLYIVGEQVFPGPGTLSSALSGYYAARSIMKEHK